MDSREQILQSMARHSSINIALPEVNIASTPQLPLLELFTKVLTGIGGQVLRVNTWEDIKNYVKQNYPDTARIVTMGEELSDLAPVQSFNDDPHLLENVELAIFKPHFAVAENGAAWITDSIMGDRALPFIAQHIALVVHKDTLIHTMHEAYQRIGMLTYNYGVFIAGPSKTADIEQSLVLGAHGPKSMTVFLMG